MEATSTGEEEGPDEEIRKTGGGRQTGREGGQKTNQVDRLRGKGDEGGGGETKAGERRERMMGSGRETQERERQEREGKDGKERN